MTSIEFPDNWSSRRRKSRRESSKSEELIFSRPAIRYVQPKHPGPDLTTISSKENDLYLSFRYFLIFGKILGVVPFQGLFQKDYKNVRRWRFAEVLSWLIMASLLVNVMVGLIWIKLETSERADQYAMKLGMFLFHSTGVWVYLHFYKHSSQLIELFGKWNNLRLYFTRSDIHLFRDVNFIAIVVMTSAIGENLFVNLKHIPMGEDAVYHLEKLNHTVMEEYFYRSSGQWARLVHYNHVVNVFAFICTKLSLYAWNYTDVMIMMFARALYFKFRALYLQGEALLFHQGAEELQWTQFVRDYETLRKFLKETNKFLSSLIFMTFGTSIYFMCMQFHNRLNPNENMTSIASIYALWSVLHLIARILLVTVSCARINDWAHRVSDLLRRSPNRVYGQEVARAENFINSHTIGLSGFGCFTITKPLILNVVGVIFTFEMVLLQALQASLNKSN